MNINLYKKYFLILLPMLYSCSQNVYMSNKYDHLKKNKNPAYETCLNDANHNINTKVNINQDRNDMLQTDDTMVDLYNIGNEIDEIKLSNKRNEMIKDCLNKRK